MASCHGAGCKIVLLYNLGSSDAEYQITENSLLCGNWSRVDESRRQCIDVSVEQEEDSWGGFCISQIRVALCCAILTQLSVQRPVLYSSGTNVHCRICPKYRVLLPETRDSTESARIF